MKKTTKAPARPAEAKGRRDEAGTGRKTTAARGAAKIESKLTSEPRTPAKRPEHKAQNKARAKTAIKSEAEHSRALERANQTIRALKAELADVRSRMAELQASAETDFLLGIFNRRGFERELSRSIAFVKRYPAKGAVIMLDLDRLKPVNDTFGHSAGDEVLKAVAATLARTVRASDVVGRIGGDEFAVLLWNLSETDARAKARALEQAIDGLSFCFGGRTVSAGASAGVAILSPHTDTQRVLEEADAAMYVRKAQRRQEANA